MAASGLPGWIDKRWQKWLELRIPRRREVTLTQSNTFIFPTLQGFVVVGVCLLLFIAGINYENNSVLALTFLIVAIFFLAINLTFFNLSGLTIRAAKSHSGFCGEAASFELYLSAGNRMRWALWVSNGHSIQRVSLSKGETRLVHVSEIGVRRGIQQPGRILIETRAPLGWIRAWTWFSADVELLIYPKPVANEQWVFSGKGTHEGRSRMAHGADMEFQGIREFQNGDSLKHIYWKGYAKTGKLLSKQFDPEESGGSELSEEKLHHLDKELRMSFLCWWLLQLSRQNQVYSLKLDDQYLAAGSGELQLERGLQMLALSGKRL